MCAFFHDAKVQPFFQEKPPRLTYFSYKNTTANLIALLSSALHYLQKASSLSPPPLFHPIFFLLCLVSLGFFVQKEVSTQDSTIKVTFENMIIRSCHQKASERLNFNNTVQAKRSAVVENLRTTSVSERRDIVHMPIADNYFENIMG